MFHIRDTFGLSEQNRKLLTQIFDSKRDEQKMWSSEKYLMMCFVIYDLHLILQRKLNREGRDSRNVQHSNSTI
jgi:hypothetical protein